MSTSPSPTKNRGRLLSWFASGMSTRHITAPAVPAKIKGMRRPMRVCVRSESTPNSGSMNRASTLSSAITAPDHVSPMPKVYFRIRGMIPS